MRVGISAEGKRNGIRRRTKSIMRRNSKIANIKDEEKENKMRMIGKKEEKEEEEETDVKSMNCNRNLRSLHDLPFLMFSFSA